MTANQAAPMTADPVCNYDYLRAVSVQLQFEPR
jgi:hypothetical protein